MKSGLRYRNLLLINVPGNKIHNTDEDINLLMIEQISDEIPINDNPELKPDTITKDFQSVWKTKSKCAMYGLIKMDAWLYGKMGYIAINTETLKKRIINIC